MEMERWAARRQQISAPPQSSLAAAWGCSTMESREYLRLLVRRSFKKLNLVSNSSWFIGALLTPPSKCWFDESIGHSNGLGLDGV